MSKTVTKKPVTPRLYTLKVGDRVQFDAALKLAPMDYTTDRLRIYEVVEQKVGKKEQR